MRSMSIYLWIMFTFSTCYGLLLNNVQVSDLERIKTELKEELEKEFDMKLAQMKQNLTAVLNNDVSENVAFMAGLSHDIVNPSNAQHIVFDQVITNIGNGYRPLHGIFTAPYSGIYTFTLNMAVSNIATSHVLHAYIMVNDAHVGYIFFDGKHDYWFRRSDTIVVHLNKGDDIWLKATRTGDATINAGTLHQHLSGFLISKD